MSGEQQRLAFLTARDGLPAAKQWARRTAAIYRTAVLDKQHYASSRVYRRTFIESYLQLKKFGARRYLKAA